MRWPKLQMRYVEVHRWVWRMRAKKNHHMTCLHQLVQVQS